MITYDVYNVTYVDKKPICNLSKEDVYKLVTENGYWDRVETFEDEYIAWAMWRNKWSDMATTEENEYDNDFLKYSIYIFERSERNDRTDLIENSIELDYAVERYDI